MKHSFVFKRLLSLALVVLMLAAVLPVLAEDESFSADVVMPSCFLASENEGNYHCYNNGTSAKLILKYHPIFYREKIIITLSNEIGIAWQTTIEKLNKRPAGVQNESFVVDGNGLEPNTYTLNVAVQYDNGAGYVLSPFKDSHSFTVEQAPVIPEPKPIVEPVKVESFKLKLGKKFIAGKTIKLKSGRSVIVKAIDFQPANAENTTLKWSSSNTCVAGVSPVGKVVARKAGICRIVARTTDGSRIALSFNLIVK